MLRAWRAKPETVPWTSSPRKRTDNCWDFFVCVQQTALDLLARDFRVYVAADAVGSRFPLDQEYALRRMERAGAIIVTSETATHARSSMSIACPQRRNRIAWRAFTAPGGMAPLTSEANCETVSNA